MPIERQRAQELDHMVRKMGTIVSVFEIRCDPVGNKSFKAFRDLMDVYVDACGKTLAADKDFMDEGIDLDADENLRERLRAAFESVFGVAPGAI
ncbi:MAG: hypothetical protein ISP41_04510 [Alphaproteobacteria bacterium]|nr:hypothetical protein [Alphaproteobacteria bacterium]